MWTSVIPLFSESSSISNASFISARISSASRSLSCRVFNLSGSWVMRKFKIRSLKTGSNLRKFSTKLSAANGACKVASASSIVSNLRLLCRLEMKGRQNTGERVYKGEQIAVLIFCKFTFIHFVKLICIILCVLRLVAITWLPAQHLMVQLVWRDIMP